MATELVIHDENFQDHFQPELDGVKVSRGLRPRDFRAVPLGSMEYAPEFSLPLIPQSEWQDRIAAMEAEQSRVSDIMAYIDPLDQNGQGYCWAHSSTMNVMAYRAVMALPYVPLSAFAVACIIKHYRDQGGSGDESMAWIVQNGVPSQALWPQQAMDPRLDTQAMRANAALHKVTNWFDLQPRSLSQLATCLLLRRPVVIDLNWWGHSVLALDLVYQQGQYGVRFINSWGKSYGTNGRAILLGNRAIPDGAVSCFGTMPS